MVKSRLIRATALAAALATALAPVTPVLPAPPDAPAQTVTPAAPLVGLDPATSLPGGFPAATTYVPPPSSLPIERPVSELPSLGEAGAEELSPADERKIGEEAIREIRYEPNYLDDPDCSEYLNNLGWRLVAASPARQIDFEFFIIRDPLINAFALPGGFIVAHSGLILLAQNESELASVLSHEIGHVQQRHIARMFAQQRESTAIAIGSLIVALLAARSGSSQGTEAALAVGQAAAVSRQLSFSRDAEREADRVGFITLTGAGFDSRAMAAFFTRMQQGTRIYESAAPAYLMTHPLTAERIADIENRIREQPIHPHVDSLDFFLTRARLRVLQDPSQQGTRDALATFEGQLHQHVIGNSEVAAHYGEAVAALALHQPDRAREEADRARKLTTAPSALLDKVVDEAHFFAAKNDTERSAAVALAKDTASRFPLSRLAAINYADLLQRTGQHEATVAFLRDQLGLPRSDPYYFELVGRSYEAMNHHTQQHQAIAEAYVLLGSVPAAIEQLELARRAADGDFYVMSEVDARLRELKQQQKEDRKEKGGRGRGDEKG